MSTNYLDVLNHIVRHPRHLATGEKLLRVRIERPHDEHAEISSPEVVDFSRGGCRLRWEHALAPGEAVVVHLCDESSGLSLELPAVVRWSNPADGVFEAGCQFDAELNYEHLGELFLSGFLSTEEAAQWKPEA